MRISICQGLLAVLILVGAAACSPTKPEILQPSCRPGREWFPLPGTGGLGGGGGGGGGGMRFCVGGSCPVLVIGALGGPAARGRGEARGRADPERGNLHRSRAGRRGFPRWGREVGPKLRNATMVVVPSANFEAALQQLPAGGDRAQRDLHRADLQRVCRPGPLRTKATRDRIRTFLEDAKTVDEALNVNAQLSQVEGEIEQIQGRMNYLSDRAANSTIKVQIVLYNPAASTPYPTPAPWSPANTFADAAGLLGAGARSFVDGLIYFVVLILPLAAPFVILVWLAASCVSV